MESLVFCDRHDIPQGAPNPLHPKNFFTEDMRERCTPISVCMLSSLLLTGDNWALVKGVPIFITFSSKCVCLSV